MSRLLIDGPRATAFVCRRCQLASSRHSILSTPSSSRYLSQSATRMENDDVSDAAPKRPPAPGSPKADSLASSLGKLFEKSRAHRRPDEQQSADGSLARLASIFEKGARRPGSAAGRSGTNNTMDYDLSAANPANALSAEHRPPHHLHVYATKHNTHITLTKPNRDAIISVAAGNIGFRKSARGSYDAAYQLAAYVMNRIQEQGLLAEILKLELVLRGFGSGRDAVTKALMGSEGRNLRGKVVRVTDATRLKFGGTRSKKPRRLG
ncbi:MAG: hypothetical protein M1832_000149 [Thelocarpon impressellum]|nr:MAG: hypothetical protein M1832_000149 [Thelocarpon impressellum]